MRCRRFVLSFILVLFLFAAANYAIWKIWTEDLVTTRYHDGGDLARMGYLPASKMPRRNQVDLANRHMPFDQYQGQLVDVITIGDSFSNGGAGGRNRFYQDYLATLQGVRVLNIPRHRDLNPLVSIAAWLDDGFLQRTGARYVLLGVSEKACAELGEQGVLDNVPSAEQRSHFRLADYQVPPPRVSFINNGNLKFLLNSLLYRFSDHAVFSQVHVAHLSKPMFSVPDAERLLYLRYRPTPTPRQVNQMNDNLNMLADRLQRHGVRLIFMPCVDKYTLYYPYLAAPPYPASRFFEELRPLPKRYTYLDTKSLLATELEKGEKDVFYADDTHFSWKAARTIVGALRLTAPGDRQR